VRRRLPLSAQRGRPDRLATLREHLEGQEGADGSTTLTLVRFVLFDSLTLAAYTKAASTALK
jgi:hypothetical protein